MVKYLPNMPMVPSLITSADGSDSSGGSSVLSHCLGILQAASKQLYSKKYTEITLKYATGNNLGKTCRHSAK